MRIELCPDSYIVYEKNWMPLTQEEFQEMWCEKPQNRPEGFVMGKHVKFPRWTRAYGKDYAFSGQIVTASDLSDAPKYVKMLLDKLTEMNFEYSNHNGILVNYYESDMNACDYIGKHSDNERDLCKSSDIISLTWCDSNAHYRRFRLTPKKKENKDNHISNLHNGDLIIMCGNCQQTHYHEIMTSRKRDYNERIGKRINITVRKFI